MNSSSNLNGTPYVADPATGKPIGPEVDATPARRPLRGTTLEGRHVTLAPLDPAAHLDALWANIQGPEAERLWLYMSPPPFADKASFAAYLERSAASEDPFFFVILDTAGEAVGHATLMRIEPAQRVIEVGNILYTPKLQKTPAASEAMALMARHVFDDLGYRRYEWKCNALNAPSRRAAARYGFSFEGVFRQHMIVKGRSRDTAWFSMLDREWPARKAAFARWLDPANFDATGRQHVSLAALNAAALPYPGGMLRRAGTDDLAAFEALQEAAYAPNRALLGVEPVPLLTSGQDVLARYEIWLPEDSGTASAALVLDPKPDHLLVWSVATHPDRQGQGVGSSLLGAAEERARHLGLSALRLFTGEQLAHNVAWYRRQGYEVERVEDRQDRRLVHMVKHIQHVV